MANEWVSSSSQVSFGREASFGAKPAAFGGSGGSTSPRFIGITNQGIDWPDKQRDVRQYRSFGNGRSWFKQMPGRSTYSGSLSYLPTTGEFLYYAFGDEAFAAGTHTLTTLDGATLPSRSVLGRLEGNEDFQRIFQGCTTNGMSLSLTEGGELVVSEELMAKTVSDWDNDAPTDYTQPTDDGSGGEPCPYMFSDLQSDISIFGNSFARVRSFNCSLQNNLKPLHFLNSNGGREPDAIVTSYPNFELTMEAVPTGHLKTHETGSGDAIYERIQSDTLADIVGDVSLTLTKTGSTLTLDFTDIMLRAAPHPFPESGDEIVVSASFSPRDFSATVVDSVGEYSTL